MPLYLLLVLGASSALPLVALASLLLALFTLLFGAPFLLSALLLTLTMGSTSTLLLGSSLSPVLSLVAPSLLVTLLVKLPCWPLHLWLPYAHAESPTVGSVVLAALILKLSGYGLMAFLLPSAPSLLQYWLPLLLALASTSLLYSSLATLLQADLKRLIAYSSVAHMAITLPGLLLYSSTSILGASLLLVTHGLTSGLLFFLVGSLYARLHTRLLRYTSSLTSVMPLLAAMLLGASLCNLALPGTGGFIAEFLCIAPLYSMSPTSAFLMSLTLILSGLYSL